MVVGSNPAAPTNSPARNGTPRAECAPWWYQEHGFLASQFGLTLGTFDLTDWTPIAGIHAGAMVTITDTAVGLNTFFRMYSIEKAFHSNGRQDLTVSYGRYRPSIARNPDLTRLRPMTEERERRADDERRASLFYIRDSTSALLASYSSCVPSLGRTSPEGTRAGCQLWRRVLVALVTVPGRSVSRTRP